MIIQWIRRLLGLNVTQLYSKFEHEHYARFEQALLESDIRVFVYDDYVRGERLITKGTEVHCVTIGNLVSFHKLNRSSRRKLAAYATD